MSEKVVSCRPDCRYFSTYTQTCDYSLMMFRSRGCPLEACTKYAPRESVPITEENPMYIPEPPVTPPEDEQYITAGCGHEVYDGEDLFDWEGKTLCADCLSDKFNELSVYERAAFLGCEHHKVSFGGNE